MSVSTFSSKAQLCLLFLYQMYATCLSGQKQGWDKVIIVYVNDFGLYRHLKIWKTCNTTLTLSTSNTNLMLAYSSEYKFWAWGPQPICWQLSQLHQISQTFHCEATVSGNIWWEEYFRWWCCALVFFFSFLTGLKWATLSWKMWCYFFLCTNQSNILI